MLNLQLKFIKKLWWIYKMSKHYEFINEPIEDILKELVNVTSNLDKSINTYPLNDYLLKSTFFLLRNNMKHILEQTYTM